MPVHKIHLQLRSWSPTEEEIFVSKQEVVKLSGRRIQHYNAIFCSDVDLSRSATRTQQLLIDPIAAVNVCFLNAHLVCVDVVSRRFSLISEHWSIHMEPADLLSDPYFDVVVPHSHPLMWCLRLTCWRILCLKSRFKQIRCRLF